MLRRFEGKPGRRLLIERIAYQKLVGGNKTLAADIIDRVEIQQILAGETFIEQGGTDNDVYFIIAGAVNIIVNGRLVATRGPNDSVGEMAAVEPVQRRSASVVAREDTVVAKLSEQDLSDLGSRYPEIYKSLAKDLAHRLLQRNALVQTTHEKVEVFIISSTEGLPVARIIQSAFKHDPFLTDIWSDGVFKATNYTLESLEAKVNACDFAIAIAHADDFTVSRAQEWPTPRDNVIFELGLFMGRLGRARAILMEPREERVKLPSDLAGVTTIPYRYEKGPNAAASMAPSCNELRDYIIALGPNN